MTIACVVHWYESLLFLAPVAMTVGAIGVSEKVSKRREEREAAEPTDEARASAPYASDAAQPASGVTAAAARMDVAASVPR
jgi:hypothetical protein